MFVVQSLFLLPLAPVQSDNVQGRQSKGDVEMPSSALKRILVLQ